MEKYFGYLKVWFAPNPKMPIVVRLACMIAGMAAAMTLVL
jgi:hypothetical protein